MREKRGNRGSRKEGRGKEGEGIKGIGKEENRGGTRKRENNRKLGVG